MFLACHIRMMLRGRVSHLPRMRDMVFLYNDWMSTCSGPPTCAKSAHIAETDRICALARRAAGAMMECTMKTLSGYRNAGGG